MGTYYETKHDAYNLKFKEHEVFKDQLVVVDESDSAFLWLNKDTGKVSFSGKYFVERTDEILNDNDELEHIIKRFKRAISFVEEIERDFMK
ncbi:hypothetical protein [Bacillus sp. JJ722]|uniref:hypothetical protein n=1 Tax=Bacillus sp. JJ722 TaxID=3122973 RepID=UPI002FFED1E2